MTVMSSYTLPTSLLTNGPKHVTMKYLLIFLSPAGLHTTGLFIEPKTAQLCQKKGHRMFETTFLNSY